MAPDATIADNVPTSLGAAQELQDESSKQIIGGLLTQLSGAPAEQKDIDCVAAKVPPDAIAKLMSGGFAAGGAPDVSAMQPLLTAIFDCNPKGLAETVSNGLGVLPSELTPEQRSCVANATLTAANADPGILAKLLGSASLSALEPEQRAKLAENIKKNLGSCSLPAAVVDKIMKGITG